MSKNQSNREMEHLQKRWLKKILKVFLKKLI